MPRPVDERVHQIARDMKIAECVRFCICEEGGMKIIPMRGANSTIWQRIWCMEYLMIG